MEETITAAHLSAFARRLGEEEKSPATIEKYLRDAGAFARFLGARALEKREVLAYKRHLTGRGYALRSVNSMLAALNRFLDFFGRGDCRVRLLREQRRVYGSAEGELTRAEYMRLLAAARGDERLHLLLQTICATGIRVSELRCFTLEAVEAGEVSVVCKNKTRLILLPHKLRARLLRYARSRGIHRGVIFRTRSGRALDRSNIWKAMKALCAAANVTPGKVFPHNLRKLFARTFYDMDKDIAKLSDLLGHSSINTTRIYIMTSGAEHRRQLDRLRLLA